MKTLYTTLVIVFCFLSESIYSQVPLAIPYQAVARNNTGEVLTNQAISLRFSILDNSISGPVLYSETHSVTTNELGLFTVSIGNGVASTTTGPFDPTKWNILATFIKTEIDVSGGTTYIELGTSQILSVPFAAYSANSGRSFGAVNYVGAWDASTGSSPSGVTPDKGNYYVVSVAGSTDLDGITDWGTGDWAIFNGTVWEKVDNTDEVTDAELNAKVNRSGDLMTGDLILNADPTIALGAATKKYVDDSFYNMIDSYIHRTDDGLSIFLPPGGTRKRLGIGDTQPESPLGIKGEGADDDLISFVSSDGLQKWNINLNPSGSDVEGFSIDDRSLLGLKSRFFIQELTGNIGIGTIDPTEKLQIIDSVPDGDVGIKILNTASATNQGWKISHVNDNNDIKRNDALKIVFDPGLPTTSTDGMSILKSGNIGINELLPDVKLHVSRPLSETQSSLDLISGTGIVVIGPITDNVVFDYRGLQARHGEYVADVLNLSTADLNLQRLGGDILVHGDASSMPSSKVIITSEGRLGLGTTLPTEKLHIEESNLNGITGFRIRNTATLGNNDWTIGHVSNNANAEKDDALTIKFGNGLGRTDLLTISKSGNVGINEVLPYATLHVTKPGGDPVEPVNLDLGSGLMMLGKSSGSNLLFDDHQIQARTFDPLISPTTALPSGLNLQPHGGHILIYAEEGVEEQIVFTDGGKIGIGTDNPVEKLHVNGRFRLNNNSEPVISGSSSLAFISNQGLTSGVSPLDNRIGVQIQCTGTWSSNAAAKNIGLYVSSVTGQGAAESNIAAVLNGNTVIGSLTGSSAVGSNGLNVLAIQNGFAPLTPAGSSVLSDGGIQIFSESDVTGTSVFNLMNGNGTVIKLYRSAALTPADNSSISNTTYGTTEADVINNLRNRINELELKLQSLGLLN